MRSLLDGQPNRLSLLIVIVASIAATVIIFTGAGVRTGAQRAALVALHQPPPGRSVKVVAAAPAGGAGGAAPTVGSSAVGSGSGSGGGGSVAGGAQGGATVGGGSAGGTVGGETAGGSDGGGGTDGGSDTGGGSDSGGGSSGGGSGGQGVPAGDADLPKVGHVFEIGLSTTGYKAAFGHGAATYLDALIRKGTVLSGYHSLGSSELADELASVSGQLPNSDTRSGCTTFAEFPTGTIANAHGLVPGKGCVYPETALTIGDQVTASGHVWGAFVADQGKQACVHPNSNAVDDVALPFADPGYEDRHNPFVYFHSLLDLGDCSSDDVDLTKLPAALRSAAKTPTFTYIAPDACADARAVAPSGSTTTGSTTTPGTATPTPGTPTPTPGTSTTTSTTPSTTTTGTTGTGSSPATAPLISGVLGLPTAAACPAGPVGIAAEDAFLRTWVPRVLHSSAYRTNGVLVIAFSGDGTKASGPEVRTGALVLSKWTRRGATIATPYTPYSLLRSIEDMLRYQRLAEAATAKSFAAAVFHKLH